jgi:hypothetical protein
MKELKEEALNEKMNSNDIKSTNKTQKGAWMDDRDQLYVRKHDRLPFRELL